MPNRSDTLRLERTTLLLADFQRALTRLADALGQPEARSFLGAGQHLRQKRAVSPEPIPTDEWKGLA